MTIFNPVMQRAHLSSIEPDVHGLISKRSAELDGVTVTQVTFDVGARWSQDLKAYAGTEFCELPHVSLVLSGTLAVEMADGTRHASALQRRRDALAARTRRLDGRRSALRLRGVLAGQRLLRRMIATTTVSGKPVRVQRALATLTRRSHA